VLGLLAMLVQFCVSFGHVHASGLVTGPFGIKAAACTTATPGCRDHLPGGVPDDDCPICATLHLGAPGPLPAPPAIDLPVEFAPVIHDAFLAPFVFVVGRHSPFQTRAPPIG
jgi:hypothetical protein